jgi:DNA-binding response OmpR family regulator
MNSTDLKTQNRSTILVVDDDRTLRDTLEYNLRREGYHVLTAAGGDEALRLAFSGHPDLIILDIMLPGMNGFDVCRAVRKQSTVPILMLSAREEEIDKVLGLELGADDYLTKPFGLRELLARVHAMLRRAEILQPQLSGVAAATPGAGANPTEDAGPAPLLVAGDVEINRAGRTVTQAGNNIDMKPKEFDLLAFLAAHPMQVFSRETLLDRVWGYDFVGGTRTVDVHVRWLRLKLEPDPSNPQLIQTVYGVGYKLGRGLRTED